MQVLITKTKPIGSVSSKSGLVHLHEITYVHNGEENVAQYSTLYKEQTRFVKGHTYDVDIDPTVTPNVISPKKKQALSEVSRRQMNERAKYSGMAMAFAKDLVVADKVELKDISKYATKMFNLMVSLDKTLDDHS